MIELIKMSLGQSHVSDQCSCLLRTGIITPGLLGGWVRVCVCACVHTLGSLFMVLSFTVGGQM